MVNLQQHVDETVRRSTDLATHMIQLEDDIGLPAHQLCMTWQL